MPILLGALEIALKIFKMTKNLPRKEDYGFTLLNNFFLGHNNPI